MATGTRKHYDLVETTLSGAHTDTVTTLTLSAKLTGAAGDVPTLAAGEYIPLVIRDDSDIAASEIVHVTAYTSGATTCTVERGQESTTARAWSGDEPVYVAATTGFIGDVSLGRYAANVNTIYGYKSVSTTADENNKTHSTSANLWDTVELNGEVLEIAVTADSDEIYVESEFFSAASALTYVRLYDSVSAAALTESRLASPSSGTHHSVRQGWMITGLTVGQELNIQLQLMTTTATPAGIWSGPGYGPATLTAFRTKYDAPSVVSFIGARVSLASAQSVPDNAVTDITLATSEFDAGGFADGTGFTVPAGQGGTYLVAAGIRYAINGTGVRNVGIAINSNATTQGDISGNGSINDRISVSSIVELAAGDVIRMRAYQNSGGALDVESTLGQTHLSITKLGHANHTHAAEPDTDWHYVGDPGEPAFENGWVQNVSGSILAFRKDAEGFVHIKGLVSSGVISDSTTGTIFTFPEGYRPLVTAHIATVSNGSFGALKVRADGEVWAAAGSNNWFSLDGVSFFAEQ